MSTSLALALFNASRTLNATPKETSHDYHYCYFSASCDVIWPQCMHIILFYIIATKCLLCQNLKKETRSLRYTPPLAEHCHFIHMHVFSSSQLINVIYAGLMAYCRSFCRNIRWFGKINLQQKTSISKMLFWMILEPFQLVQRSNVQLGYLLRWIWTWVQPPLSVMDQGRRHFGWFRLCWVKKQCWSW